jgi:hypothetical protein
MTVPNHPDRPADPMNCQTCGACCAAGLLIAVDPSDTTPRRWTRSVRGVIGFESWEADQGIRQMARIGDRCAALAGQVGQSCACPMCRPDVLSQLSDSAEKVKSGMVEALTPDFRERVAPGAF